MAVLQGKWLHKCSCVWLYVVNVGGNGGAEKSDMKKVFEKKKNFNFFCIKFYFFL